MDTIQRQSEAHYAADLDNGERIAEAAERLITEGDTLKELMDNYEPDIWDQLARAMRSIDSACIGNKISTDAVLTAMSNIQQRLRFAAKHEAERNL